MLESEADLNENAEIDLEADSNEDEAYFMPEVESTVHV